MNPKDIAMAAYWVPKILKEGLEPSKKFVETQPTLSYEESLLFNRLREGGPCVICGSKGVHAVNVCLCQFVKKERSGSLFWKEDTYYYIRKSAAAPLCAKHYHEAKVSETKGCVGCLIMLLVPALFSYLMLLLKQRGHFSIFDDDVLTVIMWFVIGFVGVFILLASLGFGEDKGATFKSIWECGPLQRLLALRWVRCDNDVGEKQLNEAMQKGGV